jgi:hypothetical protein
VCMLFGAHMHAPAPIPWIPRMERRRSEVRSMWSSSPMTNGKKAVPPGNLTLRPRSFARKRPHMNPSTLAEGLREILSRFR